MRLPIPVVLVLFTAAAAHGQLVPPVPVHERPIPLPRLDQQWIRAVSPNFRVISSAGEQRTRQITETLETVASALRRVHPRFDARFADTTVFLFDRRRDSQPYFELLLNRPRTNIPGAFVVHSDGAAAIVIDSTRPLSTDRTVKHELMHNILATSGTRLPLWLEEGIAEYFSTTIVRGESVIIGRPILPHQRLLRARGGLPVEELLSARIGAPIASNPLFYPQSWALVEWMMRTSRKAFYAFVADVEKGEDTAEAFQRHFSMEIGTVARSFRLFSIRPSASSTVRIQRIAVPVAITAISTADVLHELGQFLGRINTTRDDAERHLRAALESDPDHALSIATLGTLRAWDRKYAEAEAYFEEALRIDPRNPAILTAFAEALLQNAIGPFAGVTNLDRDAPARFRFARQMIRTALSTETTPIALAILGTTYLTEDDVSDGIEALEKARAARPARLDFALNLYALYLRAEQEDQAAQLFQSVFARTENAQTETAARAVYIREQIARANRFADLECYDDAADIIKRVIELTADPAARAELTREVGNLRQVAEVNRQIMTYNEAVAAYNQEELRTALERLDFLLTFVTDEQIRTRADQLRTMVRRRLGM